MTGSRVADAVSWAAFAVAPVLLALAADANLHRFNPDAVAYMQLALHWRAGAFDLAASSYWGPLFPWIAAAVLGASPDAVVAARVTMAISAMIFLGGALLLLRRLAVPDLARVVGAACVLAFALAWSVQIITPDLLVSGILMLGMAAALHPAWRERLGVQAAAGALFGFAYYAKAIALPLSVGLIGAAGAWCWFVVGASAARRAVIRTGLAAAMVAAPWVLTLSVREGAPTMGSAGSINFAIAGPTYTAAQGGRFDPRHPAFTEFHVPREGRVTAWEEARESAYRTWSPFTDAAAARHFLRLLRHNMESTVATLAGFGGIGLGLAAILLAPFIAVAPARPWRFVVVPVAMTAALYLPVISNGEPRYLMLCYPLLLAAVGGLLFALEPVHRGWRAMHRSGAMLLLAGAFLLPLRFDVAIAFGGRPIPAFLAAQDVAAAARQIGASGGVASVGELGFAGIFTAFLLQQPFMGTEGALPGTEALRTLGVRLLLVEPGSAVELALATEPDAERLPTAAISAWLLR